MLFTDEIITEEAEEIVSNLPEEATDFLTWLLNLFGVANTGEIIEVIGVVCIAIMAIWKIIPYMAKFFPALGDFYEKVEAKINENSNEVNTAVTAMKEIASTTNSKLATQETEMAIVMKALYAIGVSSSIDADGKKIVIECLEEFDKLKNDNTRTNYVAAKQEDETEELLSKSEEIIAEQEEKDAKAEERISVVDAVGE